MADISDQLNTIETEPNGEPVLTAISSALTAIKGDADIASELYTITNGRYGSDIRMAIHDAIYKVSQSGGSGKEEKMLIAHTFGNAGRDIGYIIGTPRQQAVGAVFTITITGVRTNSSAYVQFAELCFYDTDNNLINITDSEITSTVDSNNVNESIDKVIDGSADTKYCASWNGKTVTITLYTSYNGTPKYFSYITANDFPERDPVAFTIDIVPLATGIVTRVLEVVNATITSDRKTETQKFEFTS